VLAVRPYNWEARVLKLRILRQQNADNFADLFERRYEEALDVRDENPEEALTALETLKVIRPNYQGIDQEIRELEIELGLRPDPVTQQQRQEASRLLTRARELTEEGSAAQTRAAINLLEEAVSLNPENNEAKVLLDRLRIDTGGQATATLTSAEEQQLRRAETLFVENKVAQAFAIVERLMQEEENRLYPPLLDLRKRIVSRLGM
jgi:tetratricopeptide (TPR) repeat protein